MLLEPWMMEVVVTTGAIRHAMLLHSNRNLPPPNKNIIYRLDAINVAQLTVSEH